MTEIERLRDGLRRAVTGEAWHGPGVLEILETVSGPNAEERILVGRHTIQEIVLHVAAWFDAAAERLRGGAVDLAGSEDWPTPSPGGWVAAKARLVDAHDRLQEAMAVLTEDDLDALVPGKSFTARVMLDGMLQHVAYHAGQIAILKKI